MAVEFVAFVSFSARFELIDAAVQAPPGIAVVLTGELVPAVWAAVDTVGLALIEKPVGAVQVSPMIGLVLQKSTIMPLIAVVLAGLKVTRYDCPVALGVELLIYKARLCTCPPVGNA